MSLKEAKYLYDLGFSIIWLRPKSKMPVENAWTSGPRKEWKDLVKSSKTFYNVGVRLGETSKLNCGNYLMVIDCDVKSKDSKHAEEMNEALKKLQIPQSAPVVLSGRGNGSCHIYFKSKEPLKGFSYIKSKERVKVEIPSVSPNKVESKELTPDELAQGLRIRPAWEISIMGNGQQVVLPPSIHPDSKKNYEWSKKPKSENDFPLVKISVIKHENSVYEADESPNEVELIPCTIALDDRINEKMIDLIMEGEGCEDRSAALLSASMALLGAGFKVGEVLYILTDRSNYLGQAAYDHRQTKSRKEAAKWLLKYTIKKAQKNISGENLFKEEAEIESVELSDEDAQAQAVEILDANWRDRLQRNKVNGPPKITAYNTILILNNFDNEKTPLIGFDEFHHNDIWFKDAPWGSKKGKHLSDIDLHLMRRWFSEHWRMELSSEKVDSAVRAISFRNSFHPIRDYLNGLKWDGTKRLDSWLADYMGAKFQPKEYLAAVGRKFLVAMVARIFEPGCKFDSVLIFEGEQETGKSTAARVLAGEYFNDSELDLNSKDGIINIQGIWVYELGELSTLNRHDSNKIKQFISSSTDIVRLPHDRKKSSLPRQCIFIGTTNDDNYLKDKTGNRRYWPVKCSTIDTDKLGADRDQLLAEAVVYYNTFEPLYLTEKAKNQAKAEQLHRVEDDILADYISDFLNDSEKAAGFDVNKFRISDLYALESFGPLRGVKSDRASQMRVAGILRTLGYENFTTKKGGISAKYWVKK